VTPRILDSPRPSPWTFAQATSVVAAVGVMALLVVRPEIGLVLTWDILVPAVPLLLLLAPGLWRNLCPIAVVHQLPTRLGRAGTRRLDVRIQRWAPVAAVLLFLMIVPLRLVLFNESGPALVGFVVSVLAVALVGGALYVGKAGWCSTFCPVLPVERLYGQDAPMELPHAHCEECVGCTRACFDLGPRRSLRSLTRERDEGGGMFQRGSPSTAMGAFAAAFPGFVLGYFLAPEAPTVAEAYGWTLGTAATSLLLFSTARFLLRIPPGRAARLSAALALALYYWFALPAAATSIQEVLGTSGVAPDMTAARVGVAVIAFGWLVIPRARNAGSA